MTKSIKASDALIKYPGINLSDLPWKDQKRAEVVILGFWVFLMSDLIIFGLMFATYITMFQSTANGPDPKSVFDLSSTFIQTLALLLSSVTFGLATLGMRYKHTQVHIIAWLVITLGLGGLFLFYELHDFSRMLAAHAGPARSGFLSAFFGLVPLHGLHVTAGSIWLVIMIAQILILGMTAVVKTRLLRLGIFWHFLDIIWVGIFSIVYLMGLVV